MSKKKSHSKDSFWEKNEASNFLSFTPPLKISLYSEVATLIGANETNYIMDYGCGEGNQIPYLNRKLNIDLYDINIDSAKVAYRRFKDDRNVNLIQTIDKYLKRKYDVVIVNMVWMCVPNEKQIDLLLSNINLLLKDNGKAIFSLTHPCFREKSFSYYETDYTRNEKSFKYAEEGKKFNVYIKNLSKTVFQDYHYSLQFTYNKMKEFNFFVSDLIELSDKKFNEEVNSNYPPYLIIGVKKRI